MDPTTIAGDPVPRTRITFKHAEYSCLYVTCQVRRSDETADQADAIARVSWLAISDDLTSCCIERKEVSAAYIIVMPKFGEATPWVLHTSWQDCFIRQVCGTS